PFYIYDEKAIRENARRLNRAFSWVPGGYTNFFAVKALPNPYILEILREEGMGVDCSSGAELTLAERVGFSGREIMFTSNDTPASEYQKAKRLGAAINLDDISHIPFLAEHAGIPPFICFRYNPGPLKEGNVIIGSPEEAKYGLTRPQMFEAFRQMKELGVEGFGLHTMVASNELEGDYFVETARIMFELAAELSQELGISFDFINLGGGIGIPYRPGQGAVDLEKLSEGIREHYEKIIKPAGLHPLRIVTECGRMVTGPYGYLVSRVIHRKETYKTYIGLDANMANLMRPGMYGAYHHITVLGKEDQPAVETCDVTGSLCENNDKFAIDRRLPKIDTGDLLVLHDGGAHGHAMGFNYNGKLRSAEFLMDQSGRFRKIRRAETEEDYLATLDFSGLTYQ
ncbi:MAG: diaminopimelate decarboxylase, partial [Spirochaetales bacterium]|nr:diaminopimelate decarboxylase [Spirochaetales bacterium]MCF7938611.1 diaminopimelate decarboxylase [Spirochaetales bacterium]